MNQFVKCLLALVIFGACIGSSFADDDINVKSILDQLPLDNLPDLSSLDLPPDLPIDLVEPGQEVYAVACWALSKSTGLDLSNRDLFDEWMNDETVVEVPLVGTFVGVKDIAEYVSFITADNPFLDYYKQLAMEILPLSFTEDKCEVFIAQKIKSQITSKYSNGEKVCLSGMVGYHISFTVDIVKHFNPLTDDSGLVVKRVNMLSPDNWPYFGHFGGDAMTDFVCNDVLRDSCPEVYEANELDEESCKATFEALPAANENNNFVDDNSRGCLILHSTFAMNNKQHCPHISFLPMKDGKGKIKCQVSDGVTKEDLFTPEELEFYGTTAINL